MTRAWSLLLFFILPAPAMADAADCEAQARRYGDGKGPTAFPATCHDQYRGLAPGAAIARSSDGKLLAFGYRNALFVDGDGGIHRVIAGKETRLTSVRAIVWNAGELFVLDDEAGVLVFPAEFSGNLAPVRRIPAAAGADAIAVDPAHGELRVTAGGTVTAYRLRADVDGRRPENSLEPVRR